MNTAESIIRMEFKGARNFMTPTVIEYGMLSATRAYELSKGEGIFTAWIFGVTIVDYYPITKRTKRSDDSKCCHSLEEAREYILSMSGTEAIRGSMPVKKLPGSTQNAQQRTIWPSCGERGCQSD